MRYMGIDYGSKRVGIALSDENGTMGFPHAILPNTRGLADELLSLISRENIGAIVIGESLTLSGAQNPIARAARELGDMLAARTGLPVAYESEVFTSVQARRAPEEVGKTRAPKRHDAVDDSAAALILTQYLSRHG